MLSDKDLEQIAEKGLTSQQIENQIQQHVNGFPPMKLNRPATIGDGIIKLKDQEVNKLANDFDKFVANGLSTLKFIPASGAATRMFKALFEFLHSNAALSNGPVSSFVTNINKFAFYKDLQSLTHNKVNETNAREKAHEIVKLVLEQEGLKYGNYPKGVLKFHQYSNNSRSPLEEHLVEGALYAKSKKNIARIHFTVSPEHENLFEKIVQDHRAEYESCYKVKYEIAYSHQKPATDTIAVTPDNSPFRNNKEEILFRPGGHGALIENLNDLSADVIFIKNIDNVVSEHLIKDTVNYKKALAGLLHKTQHQVFDLLHKMQDEDISEKRVNEIKAFAEETLQLQTPENFDSWDLTDKAPFLFNFLNRPMRVCGMVKNEGEPGGGPFWATGKNGEISLQIVETSQIDADSQQQQALLAQSSHFNPVDLVVATKNFKGEKFDLLRFVDPKTGFISNKSQNGKALKALELPGLWNGAMSDWITLFVEVPVTTFNPVKTVNDLLRPAHQPVY